VHLKLICCRIISLVVLITGLSCFPDFQGTGLYPCCSWSLPSGFKATKSFGMLPYYKCMFKDGSCYLKAFLAVCRLIHLLTRLSFAILEVQKCWYADFLLVCDSSYLLCLTTLKLQDSLLSVFGILSWFLTKRDIIAINSRAFCFHGMYTTLKMNVSRNIGVMLYASLFD
jgi:hypothetical protein